MRVAAMRPREIASRLKQQFAKECDSLGLFLPKPYSLPESSLERSGRFFFDEADIPRLIQLLRENIPDFESDTLEQAEHILANRFPLLGYGFIDVGADINWQFDVINKKQAPHRPWPKIKYLEFSEVGDSKVTWEINRHQYLVTLAKAWLLTGDLRYVRKLDDIFHDWIENNPYPHGINWASSLEVAFRSLSWMWVHVLLTSCEHASNLRRDIARALAFNGWYIQRYLSEYFSPNTHLQGEAVALLFIGTLFPGLPDSAIWRKTGWQTLLNHARDKVLDDGAYFEQSIYYHVYALDFFLHARLLSERNDMSFPEEYDQVIRRMLSFLSYLSQAGPPPRFGDDDGGRVFDGRRNQAVHLVDPLAIGAALFHNSLYKQSVTCITEECLWLLGEQGLQSYNACPASDTPASAAFPQTGLYISHAGLSMRSQVVFDAGPLGGGSGGHGHADTLSLALNLDGVPLLVDPGACNYIGPGEDREKFRSTVFHNTLTVDGHSQASSKSPFSWSRWPEPTIESAVIEAEFQFISASHDGYARLQSPVTHRRKLFSSSECFWFILDQVDSAGPHEYSLRWHLSPESGVTHHAGSPDCEVTNGSINNSRLYVLTASDGWTTLVEPGLFSSAYGKKQPAAVIRLSKQSQESECVATVLWAGSTQAAAPVLTRINQSDTTPAYRLYTAHQTRTIILGDGSALSADGWESDARCLCGTIDENGNPVSVTLVLASYVSYRGQILHETPGKLTSMVWRKTS